MKNINQTSEKMLEFIENYIKEYSYPPSMREICDGMDLASTSTVSYHLEKLERAGLLTRQKLKNRAIDLASRVEVETTQIPVVGRVAAGTPILATENIEDNFTLSNNIFSDSGELFVLNVSGDSMVNIGILDRDKIVVHKQSTAENGEIVVAMVDDCATVKRFYKEQGYIRLQPENDFLEPIIVTDAVILGKVVGLIRNYK